MATGPTLTHIAQADRQGLLEGEFGETGSYRKTARIVATQMAEAFTVETDRGTMTGEPGDWLVTNDPRDDPGADLWTISADRMRSTYEAVED